MILFRSLHLETFSDRAIKGEKQKIVVAKMLTHFPKSCSDKNVKYLLLHQDNVRQHVSQVVTDFSDEKGVQRFVPPALQSRLRVMRFLSVS